MVEINEKFMLCVCISSCIIMIPTCMYVSYIVDTEPKTDKNIAGIVLFGIVFGAMLGGVVALSILTIIQCFL